MAPEQDPQYVDDDHAAIAAFAEAFLDEDERDSFVDHLMERRGYTRIQSWGPRDDSGDPDPDPEPRPARSRQAPPAPAAAPARKRSAYFKR